MDDLDCFEDMMSGYTLYLPMVITQPSYWSKLGHPCQMDGITLLTQANVP